ncbi:M15 family metallopeptidase [Anaerorhabdus furcosa]|uniref:D-alanyl-D-alanine carboxypeptidase n=1 Tax=Anaerorhabdus furcosa TaxID=118967 RepID=A0A1T4KS56_9FIRM|nr:M15 family metallopeptidase [Anaerorhabdus furcosa]SJZ45265.1 D-alanyl-D-alanine carboxypeptidase [Anaerorhabdus furcosa]
MKKLIALLLVGLVLVGCSDKKKPESTTTPIPTPISTVEPTPIPLDHDTYDSLYVIINKNHPLPEDFEPSDLVVPNVLATKDGLQIRQEAATALEDMFNAAKEEGITLRLGSGYRSYSTQNRLFNNYVAKDGEEAANRYSARPGQSEHQTGWAVDISDGSMNNWLKNSFKNTPEGIWLAENSYKYGFVLRYTEEKEEVTGYIYEPWHFRYIGLEEAQKITESGLTLEEFYNYMN